MKKTILSVLGLIITSSIFANQIGAQNLATGIAYRINLVNEAGFDGAVICSKDEGFKLCESQADPEMYGVQSDNPAAHFERNDVVDGVLVINTGIVDVAVDGASGQIAIGDYVTTSTTPGVAIKADRNGYVLGTALDPFLGEGRGSIRVALNIHPVANLSNTRTNLIKFLTDANAAATLSPIDSFRYVLAALMALISFGLGFVYFGKMSNTSVQAIGRNPLATKQIQMSVLLHVIIAIVIVLVGLAVAYMILVI